MAATSPHSVIVPVFQDRHILQFFLDSLGKSLELGTQVILVNDGSGDTIQRTLEQWRIEHLREFRIEIISHDFPRGHAKSINEAITGADGEYITLLDSDTILPAKWQPRVLETFHSKDECGIVGAKLLYPQTGGIQHCGLAFTQDSGRHLFLNARKERVTVEPFRMQCVVFAFCSIKSTVFRDVGGLDDAFFNGYEDLDFQMQAEAVGYRVYVDPEIVGYHWERSNGRLRAQNRKNNLGRFWQKWGARLKPDLWEHVTASLDKQILKESDDSSQEFLGLDLAEIRTDASHFWNLVGRTERIRLSEVLDRSYRIEDSVTICLAQALEKDLFRHPQRLLILVDNFVRLLDNRYWMCLRASVRDDDLIADLYGNTMLLQELEPLCWPGRKVR